jgi:phosphoglycolate phosphatase
MKLKEEVAAYRSAIRTAPKAKPYPGIVSLIKQFKEKGIRMVVLSSDLAETILREIKDFGLEGVFEDVFLEVHDKGEVIHELIEKHGFAKDDTIFIGDSNHEVEVGKLAGIKTGAVTWGFSSEDRLRMTHPDFIVGDLKELEEIILGNSN